MSEETLCITCGSPVRIVGDVTKSYEPIHAHDRSYIRACVKIDKLTKQMEIAKEALIEISKFTDGPRSAPNGEMLQGKPNCQAQIADEALKEIEAV